MSIPSPDDPKRNWFTTLPGILTSGGGFIAALTGLLVALNQTGILPVKTTSVRATSTTHDAPASSAPTASSGQTAGSDDALLGLIYQTRQLQVLGTTGCTGDAVMIRFTADGESGCAMYHNAVRGQLESGANVILVPVTTAGRGTAFDLLYNDEGPRISFIGILPGDGSGNLTVSLESGLIVERNGTHEKRSTLRSGRVVPY